MCTGGSSSQVRTRRGGYAEVPLRHEAWGDNGNEGSHGESDALLGSCAPEAWDTSHSHLCGTVRSIRVAADSTVLNLARPGMTGRFGFHPWRWRVRQGWSNCWRDRDLAHGADHS